MVPLTRILIFHCASDGRVEEGVVDCPEAGKGLESVFEGLYIRLLHSRVDTIYECIGLG